MTYSVRKEEKPLQSASYEDVAGEYYDRRKHPTCGDLRELSELFLIPQIRGRLQKTGNLVEVGAGRSILAPEANTANALRRVFLVDSSRTMLLHSQRWTLDGATAICASAESTGLPPQTASLVVSSLGDPYNGTKFWQEVARLLMPGGTCLFTTPSFEWSTAFRQDDERNFAEFVLGDGKKLYMPSYVYDRNDQASMISSAGLRLERCFPLGSEMLGRQPAPKLACVASGVPVVTGYVVTR